MKSTETGRCDVLILVIITAVFINSPLIMAQTGTQHPESLLTLEDAIDMAIEKNYRIKSAAERVEAAGREKKSAQKDFLPKAQVNYRYTSLSEQPITKSRGTAIPVGHKDQYRWDVRLVQPLFTGFALSSRYDIAGINLDIKKLEEEQVILDIARDVKNAYFNILLSRKLFLVSNEAVNALIAHAQDAQHFYDQELIPLNDLLRAQVALADAEQEKERAAAGVKLALSQFNLLLTREIHDPTGIEDVNSIPEPETDYPGLATLALEQRPLVRAVRRQIDQMEKSVRLAQSEYYPKVSLVGGYEQNGDDPAGTNNDYGNEYNSSVSVQVQWNFFEWGKTKDDSARFRHERRSVKQQLKSLEDNVRLEVENAFLNLNVAFKNIATAQKALGQARENWRITRLQYQKQVATSTDVLDARTFLSQADTNYYKALYGYQTALGELDRAVGRK